MKHLLVMLLLMGGINLAAAGPTADGSPPILPNPQMTPGVFISDAGLDKICQKGYTATVRYVTEGQKNKVFKQYGIERSGEYEVDHLISLELGGSNDDRNLWPQSYRGYWNARIKDIVENRLHYLVCAGKVSLQDAQYDISNNWIKAYCKYVPSANCKGLE